MDEIKPAYHCIKCDADYAPDLFEAGRLYNSLSPDAREQAMRILKQLVEIDAAYREIKRQ